MVQHRTSRAGARVTAILVAAVLSLGARQATDGGPRPTLIGPVGPSAPGAAEPDAFRDDLLQPLAPRRGGRVVVHLAAAPRSLNYMVDSWAVTRQLLGELHDSLIRRDPETFEWIGGLAERWDVEDALVLTDGRRLRGRVEELDGAWTVTPHTLAGEDGEATRVAGDEVERVDRGTVITFHLRAGVKWHDGHPFTARDVLFSYECFRNPHVHCDKRRYRFEKIESAVLVGESAVRFTFAAPYFLAFSTFDDTFTILPSHLYDLRDPDHAQHDPEADDEELGRHVNEHPRNREWIGLGPYRLVSLTSEAVDARRFDGFYDVDDGGWLDEIRWRILPSYETVRIALLNGELDFTDRLSSTDYFEGLSADEGFAARYYAGYYFTPYMGYLAWNTKRPALAAPAVRRALGLCFDWSEFIDGFYKGLAFRVTGDQYAASPTCDKSLAPLPYDPDEAQRLLAENGWYDRDGDGWVDKDGAPLELELLAPGGNQVSRTFGLLFQEQLKRVGVRLKLAELELATLGERLRDRNYDAVSLGLALAFESDPEQLWHSRWADGPSLNRSGLADDEVDRLIEAIQVEPDDARRIELFHLLQRRVYELQPFLFGVSAPRRFAMARRVRNFQILALDPGYSIRRWFVVDDER